MEQNLSMKLRTQRELAEVDWPLHAMSFQQQAGSKVAKVSQA
jgi:hypothetical protein